MVRFTMPAVRSALRFVFRRIAAIYFREIEVAGDVPARATGGRLFAANHVNGLVDPVLVLTQAPCDISPVAKSTLWKIPGLAWLLDAVSAVPIIRRRDAPDKSEAANEEVFARVATHLGRGGNILIFPEGTSHNEPHLLALRSGAGRMLARAAKDETALSFQAVALEFDARDVFRSRALVLFGPVRTIPAGDGVDVATAITDAIRDDLSELLVEGASWDERLLIVRVAEMFAEDARDRSLLHVNRLGRRIEQARRLLAASDPATVAAVEAKAQAYVAALARDEILDRDVVRASRTTPPTPHIDADADAVAEPAISDPGRATRAALMILSLPLAIVAAVVYWLPYQLPRFVTRRLGGDPDTASTYKLGVGLLVYPIWATLAVTLVFLRLPFESACAAAIVLVLSPFAALAWLDRWDHLSSFTLDLAPPSARRDRLLALADDRRALMTLLESARARAEDGTTTA